MSPIEFIEVSKLVGEKKNLRLAEYFIAFLQYI